MREADGLHLPFLWAPWPGPSTWRHPAGPTRPWSPAGWLPNDEACSQGQLGLKSALKAKQTSVLGKNTSSLAQRAKSREGRDGRSVGGISRRAKGETPNGQRVSGSGRSRGQAMSFHCSLCSLLLLFSPPRRTFALARALLCPTRGPRRNLSGPSTGTRLEVAGPHVWGPGHTRRAGLGRPDKPEGATRPDTCAGPAAASPGPRAAPRKQSPAQITNNT